MNDVIEMAMDCLTETQRRRYIRYLHGDTLTHIAKIEEKAVRTIKDSVELAKKKIKKRLSHLKNTS